MVICNYYLWLFIFIPEHTGVRKNKETDRYDREEAETMWLEHLFPGRFQTNTRKTRTI